MPDPAEAAPRRLPVLDRYLTLWIFAAMWLGLGTWAPDMPVTLERMSAGTTKSPIDLGLMLMMYLPLPKVRSEELRHVFIDKRLLALSHVQNWVGGPVLMFALAVIYQYDHPGYMTGLILIGFARCIAMVLVRNQPSRGGARGL